MKHISLKTKTLFSILFPVLLIGWNLGFDLGAFGTVFYHNVITAWIFAVSTFIALIYVKLFDKIKVRLLTFFILLIPILWPLIDLIDHNIPNQYVHYFILFDYVLIILALLYTAYIFLRMIKYDIFEPITNYNKAFIVIATLVISLLGYGAGKHHYYFIECGHFEVSGDFVPSNCLKVGDFRTLYRHVW